MYVGCHVNGDDCRSGGGCVSCPACVQRLLNACGNCGHTVAAFLLAEPDRRHEAWRVAARTVREMYAAGRTDGDAVGYAVLDTIAREVGVPFGWEHIEQEG
jgi:hypothetical protein